MLVTFMDEHWKSGASAIDAAITGAGERLRPIMMTACAMTVGMVPMALGLERGSQMEAPLGRAVIGGPRDVDFRHLARAPLDFCRRDRPASGSFALPLFG